MDDLLKLAERVEAATGPDRELDADILEASGGCAHRETKKYVCQDDSGYTCLRCGKDTYFERVPKFSASLDAAMTLVPEGFGWRLWVPNSSADFPLQVCMWGNGRTYAPYETEAATPALALTAASLRARAGVQS